MAVLTVQRPAAAGVVSAMAAAAGGGDSFPNTGKEWVRVTNSHADAARTVTFDAPGVCDFHLAANAAHDLAVTVAAQTTRIVGPFPIKRFNDANQRVAVTYSDSAADLTIAVFAQE
jgi:hypothetical protein